MFTDNHSTLVSNYMYDIEIVNVKLKTSYIGVFCECDMKCVLFGVHQNPVKAFMSYEYNYVKIYHDKKFNKINSFDEYEIVGNEALFYFSYTVLFDPDDLVKYSVYDKMKNNDFEYDLDIYENYLIINIK